MAAYNPKSLCADEFINDDEILETLEYAEKHKHDIRLIRTILEKARPRRVGRGRRCLGLTHREASVLLACDIPEVVKDIYRLAYDVKMAFYGNHIVVFAPLYLSNYCVNSCVYCPYHIKNKNITRKKLTQQEVYNEVVALQNIGHKRLLLESGEDPTNNPIEYILDCIRTVYSVKHKNGAIRRVNINIAATTCENYRRLKEAKIGTYLLFQKTYHKDSYKALHPAGPKHDYNYHTEAMDRAMEGGIDDVGLGVLFGLERYQYELAGLLMHVEHLKAIHGVEPHTISVSRLKRADGFDPRALDNGIDDETFVKIMACIRIAAPYTGMIISTRETEPVRRRLLNLGISQISCALRMCVGGYDDHTADVRPHDSEQFDTSDQCSLDEVVCWLMEQGHIPSFCTACYRAGRTGDRFMSLCKSGQILNCCHPNALMTLTEYLEDHARELTKRMGYDMLKTELNRIPSANIRQRTARYIADIRNSNRRDFCI